MIRPPLQTRQNTTTTDISTESYPHSDRSHDLSTAFTSPDLLSPRSRGHHGGRLEAMLEVFEGSNSQEPPPRRLRGTPVPLESPSNPPLGLGNPLGLGRGPSVKDRASVFEQGGNGSVSGMYKPGESSTSAYRQTGGGGGSIMERTRSTSPLRLRSRDQSAVTPNHQTQRRVPVPSTEPAQTRRPSHHVGTITLYPDPPNQATTPQESPTTQRLNRGSGSTKKMVQQWEKGSTTNTPTEVTRRLPTSVPRMTSRQMSREYLDSKPLPVPGRSPMSQQPLQQSYSASYATTSTPTRPSPTRNSPYGYSPNRTPHRPSPLHQQMSHLQTPVGNIRERSKTLTPSPSSYSIGSDMKRKGKSPLKDILNKFGGGIREIGRRAKGKGRGSDARDSPGRAMTLDNDSWDGGIERIGSAGLPGGIVFSDRMGDQEMSSRNADDPNIIRTSPIVYLIPTPCSSVSAWGSWLTSYASLTSTKLNITYCPVFHNPQSGRSTPRRVLSGSKDPGPPGIPFSSIQPPGPGVAPDVEMDMRDCAEVRSLRREEIRGRGIPPAPEGIGTEVLEILWSDGSKRYLGVEGVAGRLGWVSAIWDVLLANKPGNPPVLPPPSPMPLSDHPSPPPVRSSLPYTLTPLPSLPHSSVSPCPSPQRSTFQNRIASLEASTAPPVQKVGDTWVAASVLGASDIEAEKSMSSTSALRDSVQRMFDTGPDNGSGTLKQAMPTRRGSEAVDQKTWPPPSGTAVSERIKAWQSAPSTGNPLLNDFAAIRRDSQATIVKEKSWQPTTERELSIFATSRPISHDTESSFGAPLPVEPTPQSPTYLDRPILPRSETLLSFDPNDLNPSRSASQVRRAPTAIRSTVFNRALTPVADERESETQSSHTISATNVNLPVPTHISHVTFPKPTVGGYPRAQVIPNNGIGQMEAIPEGGSSGSVTETTSGTSRELHTPNTQETSITTMSMDPTVLAKLDSHSEDHDAMNRQMQGFSGDLRQITTALSTLVNAANNSGVPTTVPDEVTDKLGTIHMDVKAIENALQLSTLANARSGISSVVEEPKLPEIHTKLDKIASLCEEFLAAKATSMLNVPPAPSEVGVIPGGLVPRDMAKTPAMNIGRTLGVKVESEEEKSAGEEVAQIMADLTGGSNKASPRLAAVQVLHNEPPKPAGEPPKAEQPKAAPVPGAANDEVTKQVTEVLGLVKELKEARTLQTQQTTDIARYLNDLNGWLEKFVQNSTNELTAIGTRLTTLVGSEAEEGKAPVPGLPELVADLHKMVADQKRQKEAEGPVGARLDDLLKMMGEERQRHAGQHTMVEQIYSILEKQRQDNEMLLRALANDLTSEIRGERLRFVESMQQATSLNIHVHVEEFKNLLSTEVNKSMAELGAMKEQKKALEHQIADLFALKAKHGGNNSGPNSRRASAAPPTPAPPAAGAAKPPAQAGRGLPAPPPGKAH